MRIGVSTLLYENEDIITAATRIANAGHRRIELFCEIPGLYPGKVEDRTLDALASLASLHGVVYSIHPPCKGLNPASSDPEERARVIKAYVGTIELAERLGIRDMVVHCGSKSNPDVPREAAFDLAGDTLQTVGEAARRAGIAMLLENTCWGETSILRTPQDLVDLAGSCPPSTQLLLDTGHAAIWGVSPVECASAWLPRLGQIHAHDNHGEYDEHLPLGEGIIDWCRLIHFLVEESWNGVFMIEVGQQEDSARALESSLDVVHKCLARRERVCG
ncbi:MAG: sugar phosphate isomerase/epimerase family protein [Bacillota bacterium]